MKHITTFVITLLLAGSAVLVWRAVGLTGDSEGQPNTAGPPPSTAPMKPTAPVAPPKEDHSGHGAGVTDPGPVQAPVEAAVPQPDKDQGTVDGATGRGNDVPTPLTPAEVPETVARNDVPPPESGEIPVPEQAPTPTPAAELTPGFAKTIAGRMGFSVGKRENLIILENTLDPVTGAAISANATERDYLGHRIRFESAESAGTFGRSPSQYLGRLWLEQLADGSLAHVDLRTHQVAAAETCFNMGGKLDFDRDTFHLHRGYRFHFCCWPGGCGDKFLANPAAAYPHYGLAENEGKLDRTAAPKSSPITQPKPAPTGPAGDGGHRHG